MNPGIPIRADNALHRKTIFYIVAAAFLIASLGFTVVFFFFAWLPYSALTWMDTLPPAEATHKLNMIAIFARTFTLFLVVFTGAILPTIVARKRRSNKQQSKKRHPLQSI